MSNILRMFECKVLRYGIISIVCTLVVYIYYENWKHGENRVLYQFKDRQHIMNEELLKPEEKYAKATLKYNCKRPNGAVNYTICDQLPYSTIACRNPTEGHYGNEGYLVPNVVHYIWFGNITMKFYHYLSVRSAAANQRPEKIIFHLDGPPPGGHLWDRLVNEIPCLETRYLKRPDEVFGNKIKILLHKTDVARNDVLIKHGGIYIDSDVFILKSLDELRHYAFSIGQSIKKQLSWGSFLCQPDSTFLQECIEVYKTYHDRANKPFAYYCCRYPKILWKTRPDLPVHVELTSMQRPNPWCDGQDSILKDSYNITHSYMLHIHPSRSAKYNPKIFNEYGVNELRTLDTTYGAAARAALFGFQDLVYLKDEKVKRFNRKPAKQVEPFVDP